MAWGHYTGFRGTGRSTASTCANPRTGRRWACLDKGRGPFFLAAGAVGGRNRAAPVIETVIALGPKADWITVRGFTIEGCEGTAVQVRDGEHCLIAGNTIHDTGGRLGSTAAVVIQGGHDCGVVGNDLFEVCNYGIRLDSSAADRETLTPTRHYAENNYIHHIGVLNGHGCGIYLAGVALRASHNLIHDITAAAALREQPRLRRRAQPHPPSTRRPRTPAATTSAATGTSAATSSAITTSTTCSVTAVQATRGKSPLRLGDLSR